MSTEIIYSVDNKGKTIEFSKEECIRSLSDFLGEVVNLARNHRKEYVKENPLSIHRTQEIHRELGIEEFYVNLSKILNIPIYVNGKDEKNLMKKKFPEGNFESLLCSLERREERVPDRYFVLNIREDMLKEVLESDGFFSPIGGTYLSS